MQTRRSGRIAKQQPAAPVAVPPETPQAGNKRNDEGAIKPRQAPQLPLDEEEVAGTLATPSTSKKVPGGLDDEESELLQGRQRGAQGQAHKGIYSSLPLLLYLSSFLMIITGHVQSDCPKWLELKEREEEVTNLLEKYNALAAKHRSCGSGRPVRFVSISKHRIITCHQLISNQLATSASDKAVQSDCPKFLQLQEREAEVAVGLQQVHPGSGPGIRGRGSPRMFSRIVKSLSGSRTWKPRLGTFFPTSTTYPWSCKTSFQPQPRSDMINAMLRLWRGLRYCSRATPFR
ncbi:hypothetical protein NXS19_005669 [Fusarium pseudograminearum]|nr:hypothetical protein NXS19_005669 [Fusarium pseudograminearum]